MIHYGFISLLIAAVLYEPVRQALYHLGEEVGGVGGVGGLTNEWSCADNSTVFSHASFGPNVCFRHGVVAGLTPFAVVVLSLWTAPLLVTAVISSHIDNFNYARLKRDDIVRNFSLIYSAIELLWFSVPAAAYLSSPFYQSDAMKFILGISIAAAFPLSWNLSLVAIPGFHRAVFLLSDIPKDSSVKIHKRIAWSVVGWATVHASGELLYTCARDSASFTKGSFRFLFWAGAASAGVLIIHVVVVYFRHHIRGSFQCVHRILALILLLCATVHWWPFAFFLCPAVAVFATSRAFISEHSNTLSFSSTNFVFALSLVSVICGLCLVWYIREIVLIGSSDKHPVLPFAFPLFALTLEYAIARVTTTVAVAILARSTPNNDIPLLEDTVFQAVEEESSS